MSTFFDRLLPHPLVRRRGIAVEALPVNMTDLLQVMDLVVNGPLKEHMRRFRCA
jgi:hypothetical protein